MGFSGPAFAATMSEYSWNICACN